MSDVMAPVKERLANRPSWLAPLYAGNASAVIERGFRVIRNANWGVIATGFFEPVLYLLAMGVGMGALVGGVPGPDAPGHKSRHPPAAWRCCSSCQCRYRAG